MVLGLKKSSPSGLLRHPRSVCSNISPKRSKVAEKKVETGFGRIQHQNNSTSAQSDFRTNVHCWTAIVGCKGNQTDAFSKISFKTV
jgi:hypothetical protein